LHGFHSLQPELIAGTKPVNSNASQALRRIPHAALRAAKSKARLQLLTVLQRLEHHFRAHPNTLQPLLLRGTDMGIRWAMGAVGCAILLACTGAQARVNVDVGIGVPVYGYAPPVVVAPQPVYVAPPPVYAAPPPVYAAPPQVVVQPAAGYYDPYWRERRWREHEWRREQHWREREWRHWRHDD
jgi:hypothetical protein